jgi:hypothetical protein
MMARLLALNAERAKEERLAGLTAAAVQSSIRCRGRRAEQLATGGGLFDG